MALMDAYGLSLVSVQVWGLLWGVLSTGFIVGGLLVARVGLGQQPGAHAAAGQPRAVDASPRCSRCAPRSCCSAAGMACTCCWCPFAEAAEQTMLQKVVPYERQGRVFGFAQSVEQAASPLTAFLIGPIAQFVVIPFMTDGWGADTIGPWFGTGADRGIALVFVVTGVVGAASPTLLALRSRPYRRLTQSFASAPGPLTVGT